jgi:hypothetical protein
MNFIETYFYRYANLGFSTIPIKTRRYASTPGKDHAAEAKEPLVSWKKHQETAATYDMLRDWAHRWPSAGVGIVTGAISNLAVIDDDRSTRPNLDAGQSRTLDENVQRVYDDYVRRYGSHEKLIEAYAAADALIAALEQIPTAVARTAKGRHFYFRPPMGPDRAPLVVPTNARFLPGLDTRAEGGYVLAPPSLHPSGCSYTWDTPPEEGIAELPGWVFEVVTRTQGIAKYERVLGQERWRVGMFGTGEGERNETLASYVGKLIAGVGDESSWSMYWPSVQAWNAACSPPLPHAELETTWESICRKERLKRLSLGEHEVFVTAGELGAKTLPALGYAIDNLVHDGLTQLFGKPKAGKSLLALQMALAVALGRPLFPRDMRSFAAGHNAGFSTVQGDVLYLALEDSERRLRARLEQLLGAFADYPANLHFATRWAPLFDGGLARVADWVIQHPAARLVVIDTVAAFVGPGDPKNSGKGNAFRAEYRMFRPIWEMSQQHKIPVIMVDHASKGKGKMGSTDPFDAGAGTLGSQAAVDAIMIMEHDDRKPQARVSFKGRDLERGFIDLEHDRNNPIWRLMPPKPEDDAKPKNGKHGASEEKPHLELVKA